MAKQKALNVAYIGGGSRGWAWQLMADLALEPALGGIVRLYDIDHQAAERNAVIGNRFSGDPRARAAWRYEAVEDLDRSLTGADFVIISILPGTFEEMESDVHAPEAYGVYQSVGDTTGPGGLIRCLRTGPMFQTFAEAIRRCCPDAWVINYTNPMAQCMRTLNQTFPGIKAVGCCHEVFGTQELLAKAWEEEMGGAPVARQALRTTVMGVNHFTWITEARYQDTDLFPIYRRFAERYVQTGYGNTASRGNWLNRYFESAHRVKLELFLQYGQIAAAGDRHLAEFCPGPRYLRSSSWANDYCFTLTPVSFRKQQLIERLRKAEALWAGTAQPELEPSGEEGVAMMKALLGLGDLVTNVNLPNRGQISNAPHETILESNALFSGDSAVPLQEGSIPPAILSMSMPAIAAQEQIAEAIAARDASLAWPAFLNDPLMCTLSVADARALYRKMLKNTQAYLEGWRLDW